jgi:hypothetical protein
VHRKTLVKAQRSTTPDYTSLPPIFAAADANPTGIN